MHCKNSQTKWLQIFFPPGLGGHHLANLISLSGCYNYDVDYQQYSYKRSNAHFNIREYNNSILLHHFGSSLLDEKCKNFLCIGLPVHNQMAINRFYKYNRLYNVNNGIIQDITRIYKQHVLEKIYPGHWNTIFADTLFSTCANTLIDQIEHKLELTIQDRRIALLIHQQWIDNIRHDLNINQS